MNTYQIFIYSEDGYKYYGKTPVFSQAISIIYQLKHKGVKARIRKNGEWIA